MKTIVRISAETAATLNQTAAFFQQNATYTALTHRDVQAALTELNEAYTVAKRREEARPVPRPLRVRLAAAVRELLAIMAITAVIVLSSLAG